MLSRRYVLLRSYSTFAATREEFPRPQWKAGLPGYACLSDCDQGASEAKPACKVTGRPFRWSRPMLSCDTPEIYRGPNGDRRLLVRHSGSGRLIVRHEANLPSGGHITETDVGGFLLAPHPGPEHHALLRLIGDRVVSPERETAQDYRY